MGSSKIKDCFKGNLTSIIIILGVILGLIFGFILKSIFTVSPLALTYIGLPGKVVIRAFMLVIVPFIITSLSTSITATKRGENKRLIVLSFLLIAFFLLFVSFFGTLLVVFLKPGVMERTAPNTVHNSVPEKDIKQMIASQDEAIYDGFMNLFPDNLVGATLMTHYTALVPINKQNLSQGYKKVAEKYYKPNMLGLCAFSLILGFTLMQLEERAHTIKVILNETNLIVMQMLINLLKIMPIGMFSWMCVEAIKMKSPEKVLIQLAWFGGTALLHFTLLWFILYPGVYFLILRKNPYKMYYNIIPALLVAFGSSSSAITLPVTMKCMEEENNLAVPISRFFLPLGRTMHMPGAASYYPMATIFVAQMHGMDVTASMVILLCIYSVIQAMAFPGTPSSGGSNLAFFISTCALIGIENPFDIWAYIATIDWFFDRLRTVTNVGSDCIIVSIIEKFCHIEEESNDGIEIKESSRL